MGRFPILAREKQTQLGWILMGMIKLFSCRISSPHRQLGVQNRVYLVVSLPLQSDSNLID